MSKHDFCRAEFQTAKTMAMELGIPVRKLKAFMCGDQQAQIFTAAGDGPFLTAHCPYDAKAQYLCTLIGREQARRGNEEEAK